MTTTTRHRLIAAVACTVVVATGPAHAYDFTRWTEECTPADHVQCQMRGAIRCLMTYCERINGEQHCTTQCEWRPSGMRFTCDGGRPCFSYRISKSDLRTLREQRDWSEEWLPGLN